VVHSESKLYLVFEFLDQDLKKYMDMVGSSDKRIDPALVKVVYSQLIFPPPSVKKHTHTFGLLLYSLT
jgi:hypothetical protein